MAGKTKPKRRRQVRELLNPIRVAINAATRLTDAEIAGVMQSIDAAAEAMRTGTATAANWLNLVTAAQVAICIEEQGLVRGLYEPLHEADRALAAIEARARAATGQWSAPTLYAAELLAIRELVHLHRFQIRQLSAGEFRAAVRRAIALQRSRGGRVLRVQEVTA